MRLTMFAASTIRNIKKQLLKLSKEFEQTQAISAKAQARANELKSKMEHLEQVLGMAGKNASTATPSKDQDSRTSPLRREMTKMFIEASAPVAIIDVRKNLKAKGLTFTDAHFWKILWRLKSKGQIRRVGRGAYQYQMPTNGT